MHKLNPRLITIIAVLILSVIILFWWSREHDSAQPPSGLAPASQPGQSLSEVRNLRLGLNIAAGSALHAAAVKFAEQVAERSKGKLNVTVFPDQQLGSDDQMLEMARAGSLDFVLTPTAKLSSAIPAMQYADLPFYFNSREELYAMLDGDPGRMLLSKLNAIDLVGLTFWENGFKQFTANTPVRSPQDFTKLRIRTMKSPMIASQFETLGAQPIPIDFHATYQALAEGAVDGQENPLVAIVGMRFHEVQKHLTLSNHAYLGYVFSASKRVFASFSPEIREVIQQTARELTVWEREETARREKDFIEKIRAAGVEIHTLTAEERQRFRTAMAPIADKFAFSVGYDLLAKTDELRFAMQTQQPDQTGEAEPLIIGLNADLSSGVAQAGGAIFRGMQLAVEEINQKGGLRGRPIKIVARDHAANPQIGLGNLAYFAQQKNLLAVMGGLHSSVIYEELADIHRLQIPYLIPWAAAQGLAQHTHQPSYTFRVSISDAHVAPFLFEHAKKRGGRMAVLLERSAWGRSNETALRELINKLPLGTVDLHWIEAGATNIDATLQQLLSSGVRSVVMVVNSMEARAVVQAMAKQENPVPIFSHWGLVGGDFFVPMHTALKKVDLRFVQSLLMTDAHARPTVNAFLQRYQKRYQLNEQEMIPSLIGSAHAYDLTHLLALAVKQAGSTERAAIRHALEALPRYNGVVRSYHPPFSKERHDALDHTQLRLARFDEQGRIVAAE